MNRTSAIDVATYATKSEAEFAFSVLQSNDIEAYVQANGTGGEQVGAPSIAGFSVFVAAENAEEAKELLSGAYPADDLTHVPYSERAKEGGRPTSPIPILILGIFLGAVFVGAALAAEGYRKSHYTGTVFYGDARAGKRGDWVTYESGQIVKREYDRNLDGKPDETLLYSGNHILRVEYDDNFDGKPDIWVYFNKELPEKEERDVDFNGVPDEYISFANGIRSRSECKPNGATQPISIDTYENGVRVRRLDEPDTSGSLTREIDYDAFGHEISIKRL